ncbi:MAG: HAMP domain-containing histidine kinase, partial [Magnetospirillum sp.]|nr:HAMP domain-containing histidine kinase [Magnetospirillum sp.]
QDGGTVAALAWVTDLPGDDFLLWVLPTALLCLFALSAVAWVFWGRAWRHWRDLVAADDTRVRLLAAISHDLRQPLQSLSLFATVMDAEVKSERGRAASAKLRLSVDNMGVLLGAILKLAKLDMRRGRCDVVPVVLGEVLAPLVEEMRPQAEAKGLTLRYVPSSVRVKSDPVLLTSIIRNLISNGVRYTRDGQILVGCRRRIGGAEVWVCDTGIGIPEDKQELIFEEFYQVGNAARDFREGVGLGLAIVLRLARMLDHRVACRSLQGVGSSFVVSMSVDGTANACR